MSNSPPIDRAAGCTACNVGLERTSHGVDLSNEVPTLSDSSPVIDDDNSVAVSNSVVLDNVVATVAEITTVKLLHR